MAVGIICEYNPFHNGHKYHIDKVKELYPNEEIVLIMSGNFLERGDVSLMNKWDKTCIALNYVDLVIELPFVFASQSADTFAHGSIQLLNALRVDKLIFGSETNDMTMLKKIAFMQDDIKFQEILKDYLKKGLSYPKALSDAIKEVTGFNIISPNDLLAISYIKEIKRGGYDITAVSIKRTTDYHSPHLDNNITSATSIRNALKKGIDIKQYVPISTYQKLDQKLHFIDDYFLLIKYKILSDNHLSKYQTVDEGIEHKLKKEVIYATSVDDLILRVKSKRYTYNKIKRMLIHILCGFTKAEAKRFKDIEYVRVLGFNMKGKDYLRSVKRDMNVSLITGYSNIKSAMLDLEFRVNSIYASITSGEEIEMEYKKCPIQKKTD